MTFSTVILRVFYNRRVRMRICRKIRLSAYKIIILYKLGWMADIRAMYAEYKLPTTKSRLSDA